MEVQNFATYKNPRGWDPCPWECSFRRTQTLTLTLKTIKVLYGLCYLSLRSTIHFFFNSVISQSTPLEFRFRCRYWSAGITFPRGLIPLGRREAVQLNWDPVKQLVYSRKHSWLNCIMPRRFQSAQFPVLCCPNRNQLTNICFFNYKFLKRWSLHFFSHVKWEPKDRCSSIVFSFFLYFSILQIPRELLPRKRFKINEETTEYTKIRKSLGLLDHTGIFVTRPLFGFFWKIKKSCNIKQINSQKRKKKLKSRPKGRWYDAAVKEIDIFLKVNKCVLQKSVTGSLPTKFQTYRAE